MLSVVLILSAVFLDYLLGDPRRYHPLAGFSRLAQGLELRFDAAVLPLATRRLRGVLALSMLLLPLLVAAVWLTRLPGLGLVLELGVLYLALGGRSLAEHARAVQRALVLGDLAQARAQVAVMLGRQAPDLSPAQVTRAGIETVLINGNHALVAPIFWFLLLGAPGPLLYRLADSLQTIWQSSSAIPGFGWGAAWLAYLLNWLPARLTALGYALVGYTRQALACWRHQAGHHAAPDQVVLVTGAAALNLLLEHGASGVVGEGHAPQVTDIERSVWFVQKTLGFWLVVLFIFGLLYV